jgi:hypothetical protein
MSQRIEQRAELRIYGPTEGPDLDPEGLTRDLGFEPHMVARRGDVLRSGRMRPCTLWLWQTPERQEVDSEALVCEVLDRFEPVARVIEQAAAAVKVDVVLGLIIYMIGDLNTADEAPWADVPTPALALSRATIVWMTKLGCHLDVDQYVSAPDDE